MTDKYRRTAASELNRLRLRAGLPVMLPDRLRAMTLAELVSAANDARRMARRCEERVVDAPSSAPRKGDPC